MSIGLVDTSPAVQGLRNAVLSAHNELYNLSLNAGALAGLLDLIAGNREGLSEHQAFAIGALGDMAHKVENEITAISERLAEAQEQ